MLDAVWLIPAFPLAGFLVLMVAGRRLGEPIAGWVGTGAMVGSFVSTIVVFAGLFDRDADDRQFTQVLFEWVPAGRLSVDLGFLVDPLSVTMCLFVTGVGALIHLYSIGYMHGDENFSKFFVYMNLFAFAMLMLVLGDNLLVTFLGWEGVGLCSYLLISFWHTSDANASAGKKAFITNRVGDWGFLVAMFLAFATLGTISYEGIFSGIETGGIATSTATGIAVLLFVGAVGKSAQFPLHVWLPDAMAGPTPVSALIHAATMVTAGVYLMTRVNPVLAEAEAWVPTMIAWIGVGTALFAASIALAQTDIKKVLAYSTISQLGFMFLAVGSGAYVAAIFHMVTHAFFKALLFLGAGSVIHGVDGEQDLRYLGGLRRWMPITAGTAIVAWLAIAGIPPLSGFWSKDEILASAYEKSPALWVLGLLAALLTAFYMSRQVYLTFFGRYRFTDARPEEIEAGWQARLAEVTEAAEAPDAEVAAAHEAVVNAREALEQAEGAAHDEAAEAAARAEREAEASEVVAADARHAATWVSTQALGRHDVRPDAFRAPDVDDVADHLPATVGERREFHPHESGWHMWLPLVVLAGLSAVAGVLNLPFASDLHFLERWLEPIFRGHPHELGLSAATLWVLAIVAVGAALAGILAATAVYLRRRLDPVRIERPILAKGWFVDGALTAFMGGPGRRLFDLASLFDRVVVDGAVNGTGRLVTASGGVLRRLQTGFVRSYALGTALGAAVLLAYFIFTRAS